MPLKRTMKEAGNYVDLEPGPYMVRCMSVRADFLANAQFGSGEVIRFELEFDDMVDMHGETVSLAAIANDKLTPKAKLTRWLAAFGIEVGIGEDIDIEECVDKRCQAIVKSIPGKDGTGSFSRIEDLVPLPKTGKAQAAGELSVSDWWKATREIGLDRDLVLKASMDAYGKEPAELTAAERTALIGKIRG